MTTKSVYISIVEGDNNLTASRDIDVEWPGHEEISSVQLLDEVYESTRIALLKLIELDNS